MGPRLLFSWIVLTGVLAAAPPLTAQSDPPVEIGAVVRLRAGDYEISGPITRFIGDSIEINSGPTPLRLALAQRGLEVRGTRRGNSTGAMIGLAAGVGIGALTGGLVGQDCSDTPLFCFSHRDASLLLGAMFGAIGTALGARADAGYNWVPLRRRDLTTAVRVGPWVDWKDGPTVGLHVRF